MRKIITLFVTISVLISCSKTPKDGFSDTVIINANVYSLNWDNPNLDGVPAKNAPFKNEKWQFDAQAIAIKNNIIQFVGTDKEVKHFANGYGEINNKVPHFANTLWGAGGGLKSTISDLINYMKFQLDKNNKTVVESHKLLYSNDYMQMAYLWPVLNDSEDGTYYNIHGGAYGTQNFLLIIPKYDLGISIITNQSGPETQRKLWNTLNNLLSEIKKNR